MYDPVEFRNYRNLTISLSAFLFMIMSLIDLLGDKNTWEQFYEYKTSLCCPKRDAERIRRFIDAEGYIPVFENILAEKPFPLPEKSVISKMSTSKKRVVYTYPEAENTVMKLLSRLVLRKYDGIFAGGLYSFRPGRTAKDAVKKLRTLPESEKRFYYKADIHDYFNSVPVDRIIPLIKETVGDDEKLCRFLCSVLEEPCVMSAGERVTERKGIMAGTPLSAFFANLYLAGLDRCFEKAGAVYARYSDDIIVFGESGEKVREYAEFIRAYLWEKGLEINPGKENFGSYEEGWTFLGFSFSGKTIDIAPATVKKLKGKMRRKRDALKRWQKRNEHSGENAARAFIRAFNRKLLESPRGNDLAWSMWFFSLINTTDSLNEIDLYAQDCIRYLVSGSHRKSRYNVRYEDIKKLGYRSLVHEYYSYNKNNDS